MQVVQDRIIDLLEEAGQTFLAVLVLGSTAMTDDRHTPCADGATRVTAAHPFVTFIPERLVHRTGQVWHLANRPLCPVEPQQCHIFGSDREHVAGWAVLDAGQQRSDRELATRRGESLYGYLDGELCSEAGC